MKEAILQAMKNFFTEAEYDHHSGNHAVVSDDGLSVEFSGQIDLDALAKLIELRLIKDWRRA